MKKREIAKGLLCLGLISLLALLLAACKGNADGQNSTQPTVVTPTKEVTPTPAPPSIPFTDVPEDSYCYDAVVWAYKKGIASDGSVFDPASVCTRGQGATFLWRAVGSPEPQTMKNPFSDISSPDWYYKPALWAYENDISSDTVFNPNEPCTNGEAIDFLWRAKSSPAASVFNSALIVPWRPPAPANPMQSGRPSLFTYNRVVCRGRGSLL